VTQTQEPQPGRGTRDTQNPWEKYGWIMGAIWLVFLAFPVKSALIAETSWVWRSFAITAILAFAAVYIYGFIRIGRTETWAQVNRLGWRCLAVLLTLNVATALVIGLNALGMVTFLIAFAMFSLPMAAALGIGVAGVAFAILAPLAMGVLEEHWFFVPILLMVGVATAVSRVLEQRGTAHQEIAGEMALVAERERVARDVHDVLGHSLTVVTIKAELAERLVDADPERAKAELAQIQSLTREALAEIRATVAGLRVARLGDEITSAGAALADAGVSGQLPADPSVVDPRHRIVLAWVLREAVTNVVRHSGATSCAVGFGPRSMSVTDNGLGCSGRPEGNGLRGLRERVAAAGGTLNIGPGPGGRGTTVRVEL
jgi:two-component system, NarL family, sensor histidine kinase DesK